ncbi:hypothetical protein HK102_007411, partial [Quaeritorhiza haematococci]
MGGSAESRSSVLYALPSPSLHQGITNGASPTATTTPTATSTSQQKQQNSKQQAPSKSSSANVVASASPASLQNGTNAYDRRGSIRFAPQPPRTYIRYEDEAVRWIHVVPNPQSLLAPQSSTSLLPPTAVSNLTSLPPTQPPLVPRPPNATSAAHASNPRKPGTPIRSAITNTASPSSTASSSASAAGSGPKLVSLLHYVVTFYDLPGCDPDSTEQPHPRSHRHHRSTGASSSTAPSQMKLPTALIQVSDITVTPHGLIGTILVPQGKTPIKEVDVSYAVNGYSHPRWLVVAARRQPPAVQPPPAASLSKLASGSSMQLGTQQQQQPQHAMFYFHITIDGSFMEQLKNGMEEQATAAKVHATSVGGPIPMTAAPAPPNLTEPGQICDFLMTFRIRCALGTTATPSASAQPPPLDSTTSDAELIVDGEEEEDTASPTSSLRVAFTVATVTAPLSASDPDVRDRGAAARATAFEMELQKEGENIGFWDDGEEMDRDEVALVKEGVLFPRAVGVGKKVLPVEQEQNLKVVGGGGGVGVVTGTGGIPRPNPMQLQQAAQSLRKTGGIGSLSGLGSVTASGSPVSLPPVKPTASLTSLTRTKLKLDTAPAANISSSSRTNSQRSPISPTGLGLDDHSDREDASLGSNRGSSALGSKIHLAPLMHGTPSLSTTNLFAASTSSTTTPKPTSHTRTASIDHLSNNTSASATSGIPPNTTSEPSKLGTQPRSIRNSIELLHEKQERNHTHTHNTQKKSISPAAFPSGSIPNVSSTPSSSDLVHGPPLLAQLSPRRLGRTPSNSSITNTGGSFDSISSSPKARPPSASSAAGLNSALGGPPSSSTPPRSRTTSTEKSSGHIGSATNILTHPILHHSHTISLGSQSQLAPRSRAGSADVLSLPADAPPRIGSAAR